MYKRILSVLMLLALLGGFILSAGAAEALDPNRQGSISVAMTHDGRPVPGGSLTIYRVADVVSENGEYRFSYTADFADCSIPVTELDSSRLPAELARMVRAKGLQGTTQELSRQGRTRFSDLDVGLYLIVQQEPSRGYSKINPFLVSVPQNDDGHYIYDVDTAPKNIPEPEVKPTEPPKPTYPPKPDFELPQTGQTNWPVPVMAIAGIILLAAGFGLRASGRKKEHEA